MEIQVCSSVFNDNLDWTNVTTEGEYAVNTETGKVASIDSAFRLTKGMLINDDYVSIFFGATPDMMILLCLLASLTYAGIWQPLRYSPAL